MLLRRNCEDSKGGGDREVLITCRMESLAVLQELADTHRLLVVAATGSSFPSEKQRAGEVITSSGSDEHPVVICYALQEVPGA